MNDSCKFVFDLVRTTEDMRIVQRHGTNAVQPGQCARHFIAVHQAQLGDPNRQVAVAVHFAFINHHMVRTVHRTKYELLRIQYHFREHVFLVMLPVPGGFVQFDITHDRSIYVLVSETFFKIDNIPLQRPAQSGPFRQPNRQPLANQIVERKDIQLFAQLAVISFLASSRKCRCSSSSAFS